MNEPLKQLIALSRYIGETGRGFAILGEGNTSAKIDDDSFYVKASGTTLQNIDETGFVRVSISKVLPILDDENAGDEDVSRVLAECLLDPGEKRRPSVETMLHALLLRFPEFRYVAHAHPVYTNMLLCSKKAEEAVSGRIFPDQIVSMAHKSVYVPYVDPGLTLAREVRTRLTRFIEQEGMLPRVIMMQNHGAIAMGESPKAVISCLEMTEKASQILVGTYALGGPNFLSEQHVNRIFTRPDEKYRLQNIAGSA